MTKRLFLHLACLILLAGLVAIGVIEYRNWRATQALRSRMQEISDDGNAAVSRILNASDAILSLGKDASAAEYGTPLVGNDVLQVDLSGGVENTADTNELDP